MKISTTIAVIEAGSLITNMDHVFAGTGCFIVRGFRPEDGQYHDSYGMTCNGYPGDDQIIDCLNSGAKVDAMARLIEREVGRREVD